MKMILLRLIVATMVAACMAPRSAAQDSQWVPSALIGQIFTGASGDPSSFNVVGIPLSLEEQILVLTPGADPEQIEDLALYVWVADYELPKVDQYHHFRARLGGWHARSYVRVGQVSAPSIEPVYIVTFVTQARTAPDCVAQGSALSVREVAMPLLVDEDPGETHAFAAWLAGMLNGVTLIPSSVPGIFTGIQECGDVQEFTLNDQGPWITPGCDDQPNNCGLVPVTVTVCAAWNQQCVADRHAYCSTELNECLDDVPFGIFTDLILACWNTCRQYTDPAEKLACASGCAIATIPLGYCDLWEIVGRLVSCGLLFDVCMAAPPAHCCTQWTEHTYYVNPCVPHQ